MGSTLRVGSLPYLNSEPFFAYFESAGLLSLADALALGDAVHRLPFGIATPGATGSVHLWSHRPLEALHGATIAVTDQTSTSVRILRLLLERRHGVKNARWTTLAEAHDAVLLIGDDALRARGRPSRFAHCTDMGAEWTAWRGLPAVFATWVVRRALGEPGRARLVAAVDAALSRGLARLDAIAARRRDTGITEAEVVSYLTNFIYRFGPEEARAIDEFIRLETT